MEAISEIQSTHFTNQSYMFRLRQRSHHQGVYNYKKGNLHESYGRDLN
jgi:hypothetical protein